MSKYIINHDDPIRALSYSQISTFLRCRKQWEYSYRQNIVPSRDHTSLTIGRLVHAGMAGYWKAAEKGFETLMKRLSREG